MSDLQAAFDAAVAASKTLDERPDNQTLLRIYSLFKQATEGDASGKRPGFTDLVGRAKYDAWANLKGTSAEAAMQAYIDLVGKLKG
jgi:diazepam-binding inhibitor (GABA receptor modulating acyl-CoA-binding protein)